MNNYTHFTDKERDDLQYYLYIKKLKQKEIALKLGKHPSSICRELKRNKTMHGIKYNNNHKEKERRSNYMYNAGRAHKKYLHRRKEKRKLLHPLKTIELFKYTFKQLREGLSPELISGRAGLEGIGSISHECIYQYIYSLPGRKMELYKYLPRAHVTRRKYSGRKTKRKSVIPNRKGIELRPAEVENREEFGHWEGDSIVGVGIGAALNTNRERKSRKIMIEKIDRKTAENTRIATIKRFTPLPPLARKTKTDDNGCEFVQHEMVTEKLGMKIYFADPYASWQRGTNENGNGLVRRFFPKKTNFNNITKQEIKAVEDWINNRPMKCLGYKTPNEVFTEELRKINSLPMRN